MNASNNPSEPRIREIFLKAVEITDAVERQRFLDAACAGDAALRAHINALLASHQDDDFLERPAIQVEPDLTSASNATDGSRAPGPPGTILLGADIAPPPSTTIRYLGDYELLGEIARGGMGIVYKARQTSLNRIVAVKMILTGQFASEADVRRFRTEAEAAANLQHPNIVAIHEIGEHEGQHYFSMDYVEGKNLAQTVAEAPMSAIEAARLVNLMAETIQYAHQRGILHRDLKPQNVLLDQRGQPRITDFGLAKRVAEDRGETRSGAVMGSPGYMAPEQAAGRLDLIGPATDVYGLGAILYHLLTGQAPFSGSTGMQTMVKLLEEDAVSPRKHRPGVPSDLETVCLKCLEKRPERRYSTAKALADDLTRFLNHEPILARPASRARRGWCWLQRHPWAISGAASLLIIGLVALAYGLWERGRFDTYLAAHPGEPAWIGFQPLLITFPFMLCFFWLINLLANRFFRRHYQRHKETGAPIPAAVVWTCVAVGSSEAAYALVVLFGTVGLQPRLSHAMLAAGISTVWAPFLVVYALPFLWGGSVLVWKAVGAHELSGYDELVARKVELEQVRESSKRRSTFALMIMGIGGVWVSVISIAFLLFPVMILLGHGPANLPTTAGWMALAAWACPAAIQWRRPRTNAWRTEMKGPLLAALACAAIWLATAAALHSGDLSDLLRIASGLGVAQGLAVQAIWRAHLRGKQLAEPALEIAGAGTGSLAKLPLTRQNWFVLFLALVLVSLGVLTARTWLHTRAAYRDFQQRLASGEMRPRRGYLPAPVPDEVNFAATPLIEAIGYRERLDTNRWASLVRWEGLVKDENSFDFARLGAFLDLSLIAQRAGVTNLPAGTSRSEAAMTIFNQLSAVASALDELRQASARPYARIKSHSTSYAAQANPAPADHQTPATQPSGESGSYARSPWPPNGPAYRLLARLLVLSASAELELGRVAEAQRDLRVVAKLADAVTGNRLLVGTQLRTDLVELWLKGFWEGWVAGRWSGEAVLEAEEWLATVDLARDLDISLCGEEPFWVNYSFNGSCAMAQCMMLLPMDNWHEDRLLYNQLLFTFCSQAFDGQRQRIYPRQSQLASASVKQRLAQAHPWWWMHFGVFPFLDGAVRHAALVQTGVNQARIACALGRYRQATSHYPAVLDQLAPAYMKQVPRDVIGGQGFHYRLVGDESFLLYSIGWNELDDGGMPATDAAAYGAGDWIWPASAPQR